MITLDKHSFSLTKWLESLPFDQYLPGFNLHPLSDQEGSIRQGRSASNLIFQSLHRWAHKPDSEIAKLYDASQIEIALRQSGELSPTCALVGMCEDGLPFILDFSNPAPGSLLIAGDAGSGKGQIINSMLASINRYSQPGQIKVTRILQEPDELQKNSSFEFPEFVSTHSNSLADLMKTFYDEIEQCKKTGTNAQVHVIIVNDLLPLVARMDSETLSLFHKIIKHGPRYRLWTIAGLNSCDIPVLEPRVLQAFRTHLICAIQDRRIAQDLSGTRKLNTRKLKFGSQFFVPYGDQWLRSWICQPLAE